MPVKLTDAIRAPIASRPEAEAFLRELRRLGLDYHFDDSAVECLFGNGVLDQPESWLIEDQVAACYDAWRDSGADLKHDCPIGFILALLEAEEAAGAPAYQGTSN